MGPDSENRIGVSSGTFIDLSNPKDFALNAVIAFLEGDVYVPEVKQALQAASEFGLGLELVYRVGINRVQKGLKNSGIPVHQIHGPVIWSYKEALKGGLQTMGMAMLANGTLASHWEDTKNIASGLGAKNIVLHPYGAEVLYDKRKMIVGENDSLIVGIEPDFRRLKEIPNVVWSADEVIRIAEISQTGVVLDTSHTGITHNSLDGMFNLYERYKKEIKKGITAVHFSVAIPSENREDFFTKGTGAQPLYKDSPDWIKGAYVEFFQHVMKDPDFKGPFILEMWSFPKGNNFEGRKRAVGETLEVLKP